MQRRSEIPTPFRDSGFPTAVLQSSRRVFLVGSASTTWLKVLHYLLRWIFIPRFFPGESDYGLSRRVKLCMGYGPPRKGS